MSGQRTLLLVLVCAVAPGGVAAQAGTTLARTGVYFESYSFGRGLAFNRIAELTIPVSVTQRFGNRVVLDVATAFASASSDDAGGGTIEHSGFIDTDFRATVSVVPGRLLLTFIGTVPTGATTVPDTTIPLFGATQDHRPHRPTAAAGQMTATALTIESNPLSPLPKELHPAQWPT